tara:strand:- start:221 stop:403 length:183 start_codon:yes stop_codon:yes gene_type:complete
MARKITDEEIGKEIKKALNRLEIGTDICKSLVDYLDVPEKELTEGERCLLKRAKEFIGIR